MYTEVTFTVVGTSINKNLPYTMYQIFIRIL